MKTTKIGILGLGTVGSGFVELVQSQSRQIEERCGVRLEIVAACVRNLEKYENRFPFPVTTDWREAVLPADIVVEVMGGLQDAEQAIASALEHGKGVVTANKALIATRGADLLSLSETTGSPLRWEAAVGGGLPIIRVLGTYLRSQPIDRIDAVLNGTTNFMLGKMEQGATYDQALAEAQALGFAEADPTSDVDGWDTLYKTCILASMSWGQWVDPSQITPTGIRGIEPWMMQIAAKEGASIKLVGSASRLSDGKVRVQVGPTWIPQINPLANLAGPENGVAIGTGTVGPLLIKGVGAGGHPTGSAVLADVIELAILGSHAPFMGWKNERAAMSTSPEGQKSLALSKTQGILKGDFKLPDDATLLFDLS